MKGRKPKPSRLHKLHGTTNTTKHARRAASEPVAVGDLAGPPDWLPPGVKESWTYATANAPAGVLKAIDRGLLMVWCGAEDTYRRALLAQHRLDRETETPFLTRAGMRRDKDGNVYAGRVAASPYMRVMRDAGLMMAKVAEQMGFSPAARPRLASGLGMEYMPASVAAAAIDAASSESESLDDFLSQSPNRVVN